MIDYNHQLHEQLVTVGRKIEKGMTHELPDEMVECVLGTLYYYGAKSDLLSLVSFDLLRAKYKIWDWLGMCLTGRTDERTDSSVYKCIEKMAKLYVDMENVGGWAWFLNGHDLDVEEPHKCNDCIESYKDIYKGEIA